MSTTMRNRVLDEASLTANIAHVVITAEEMGLTREQLFSRIEESWDRLLRFIADADAAQASLEGQKERPTP